MPQEEFPRVKPGDPIYADQFNKVQSAVQRLSRMAPGASPGVNSGGFSSTGDRIQPIVRFVELDNNMLYVKQPYLDSEDGLSHTLLVNMFHLGTRATVLHYDRTYQRWDKGGIKVLVYGHGSFETPLSKGQRLHVYYHQAAGMYVPLESTQVRLAVTCRTKKIEADPESDWYYPGIGERPNVYAINFIDGRYREQPGRRSLVETAFPVADDPPLPHSWVMNHEQGYLPEGTPLWCFYLNGQWHTWMSGSVGAGSGSGSGPGVGNPDDFPWVTCQKVVIDVRCTQDGWEYDAEFLYFDEEGRLVFKSDEPCPGEGGGTGECENCPDPYGDPGNELILTVDGVANAGCNDCTNANGEFTVSRSATACIWESPMFQLCGNSGGYWKVARNAGVWRAELLRMPGLSTVLAYELALSDCTVPATLSKIYEDGSCVGPDTVILGSQSVTPGEDCEFCAETPASISGVFDSTWQAPVTHFPTSFNLTDQAGGCAWLGSVNGVQISINKVSPSSWSLLMDDGTYRANFTGSTVSFNDCCSVVALTYSSATSNLPYSPSQSETYTITPACNPVSGGDVTFALPSLTDGSCTDCTTISGQHNLVKRNPTSYEKVTTDTFCGGTLVIRLVQDGPDTWSLLLQSLNGGVYTTHVQYTNSAAGGWDGTTSMSMNLVSGTACTGLPATVTIDPIV